MQNKYQPMISVVMPVYNAEKYLNEAIESILTQTYDDFEFIILNDGSTDRSEEIILSYNDARIVYIKNETNLQIVKTLNKGVAVAKGKYIARMDADDISLPQRFEKQIQCMEGNPHIAICGTHIQIFGDKRYTLSYPLNDMEIKAKLLFNTALGHATILAKTEIFQKFQYDEEYNKSEDYELWTRLLLEYQASNIPELLYEYRYHATQTCTIHKKKQDNMACSIREKYLTNLGNTFHQDEIEILGKINRKEFTPYHTMHTLLTKFIQLDNNHFNKTALEEIFHEEYWLMLNANIYLNLPCYFAYREFNKYSNYKLSLKDKIKFYLKFWLKYRRNAKEET